VKLLLRLKRDLQTQAHYNTTAQHFKDQVSLHYHTLYLPVFPISLVACCSAFTFSFKTLWVRLLLLPLTPLTPTKEGGGRRKRRRRGKEEKRRSKS
jgi:hypothetical protein